MYLDIQAIVAGYNSRIVLRDVTLRAEGGAVLGIVGANGAGKSTLLRVISGTVPARAGSVQLCAAKKIHDLLRISTRERAQHVAVVPQGARLPDAFTAIEVVLLGRTPYLPLLARESKNDQRIAEWAMTQTDTLAFMDQRVGELSGGEQQRVLLARALAQEPQVLLLDEATAHLDFKHQAELLGRVRRLARERGIVVVAALHDLNLAALYADRLALMQQGRIIAQGLVAEVLTPALLERAYDVPVVVTQHPVHHTPLVALSGIEQGSEDFVETLPPRNPQTPRL